MISSVHSTMNENLRRTIEGKVELYNGSTRLKTFLANDNLQEISVVRAGEKGKFFGFGICQQATVKIVDKTGELTFLKGESLRTLFNANDASTFIAVCPRFYIKEATRDEKTNVITVIAYDALDSAVSHVWSGLGMNTPYTLNSVVERIRSVLGLSGVIVPSGFDLTYETGANFAGDENLRTVLNAIAEVTQTIYYIDQNENLVFKRLSTTDNAVLEISKQDYFEFSDALPVTITKIVHITELGDNAYYGEDGVTQYIRDNPFWNTRADLATLLPAATNRIKGVTIVPHSIKWRGNFLTEICDKISIQTKDGSYKTTYILDDSFTYNGGFSQTGSWEYDPDSSRTAETGNPVTIGEKFNQTFAKVDKIEKNITLYVSDVVNEVLPTKIEDALEGLLGDALEDIIGDDLDTITGDIDSLKAVTSSNTANISQLTLTTQGITQEVSSVKNSVTTVTDDLNSVVATQTTMQSDIGSLQVQANQIAASVASTEQKITTLESGLDDFVNGMIDDALGEGLEGIIDDVEGLKATTAAQSENISQLTLTSQSINNEVSSLKSSVTTITNDLGDVVATQESMRTDIGNLQIQAAQIVASVSSNEQKVSQLEGDLDDVVNEVLPTKIGEALSTGLDGVTGDINSLKAVTSSNTENISQLTLTSQAINNEVNSLKTTTTNITNELGDVVATQTTIQENVSNLQITSGDINASVVQVEQRISDGLSGVNAELTDIRNEVDTKITAEGVAIVIKEEIANGVDKVTTGTGFTFNDEGLTISKTDSEMTTTIDEDGMSVYRDNTEVLTADNQGVVAYNLHAKTYLMIGTNSRFEDYGNDRTGCFWIGG